MPRINLLPWREQERKVRRREFLVALGAAAFAAVIFVLGGKLLYSSWIDSQTAKNNLLKKEIVKLEPPTGESLALSTTCSCGLSIHEDESMLRMKVETRVLDWATPLISSFLPVSFSEVR